MDAVVPLRAYTFPTLFDIFISTQEQNNSSFSLLLLLLFSHKHQNSLFCLDKHTAHIVNKVQNVKSFCLHFCAHLHRHEQVRLFCCFICFLSNHESTFCNNAQEAVLHVYLRFYFLCERFTSFRACFIDEKLRQSRVSISSRRHAF